MAKTGSRLAALAMMLCAGCASTATFTPVELKGQRVQYVQGVGVVKSKASRSYVSVMPERQEIGERLTFVVGIANGGESDVEVSGDSVSAVMNGKPARVISRDELERSARRKQAAASALAAIGAGARAAGSTATSATQTSVYNQRVGAPTTVVVDNGQAEQAALREDVRRQAIRSPVLRRTASGKQAANSHAPRFRRARSF